MRRLPANLPAAIFLVIHTAPEGAGLLPQVIGRSSKLQTLHAVDRHPIEPGRLFIAPPDHHLLLKPDHMLVTRGPRENGFRPAVDPLFRSAARAFGARAIGIILSGTLDDGSEGLHIIKQHGGAAIVQDPEEALYPGMPTAAMRNAKVDHVLKMAEMPGVIERLVRQRVKEGTDAMLRKQDKAIDVAEAGSDWIENRPFDGPPTVFTCPECGGSLWEVGGGGQSRYRCYVGHGYTADGLAAEQRDRLEDALWSAVRALQEHAALRRRMASRTHLDKWPRMVDEYRHEAESADDRAAVIRSILLKGPLAKPRNAPRPKRNKPATRE